MRIASYNQRTCIITKEKLSKEELIAFKTINGFYEFNAEEYNGRNQYIKNTSDVIEKFLKNKKHKKKITNEFKEDLYRYAQNI